MNNKSLIIYLKNIMEDQDHQLALALHRELNDEIVEDDEIVRNDEVVRNDEIVGNNNDDVEDDEDNEESDNEDNEDDEDNEDNEESDNEDEEDDEDDESDDDPMDKDFAEMTEEEFKLYLENECDNDEDREECMVSREEDLIPEGPDKDKDLYFSEINEEDFEEYINKYFSEKVRIIKRRERIIDIQQEAAYHGLQKRYQLMGEKGSMIDDNSLPYLGDEFRFEKLKQVELSNLGINNIDNIFEDGNKSNCENYQNIVDFVNSLSENDYFDFITNLRNEPDGECKVATFSKYRDSEYGISSCTMLVKINVSSNFIETLPATFVNLVNLKNLDISKNRLVEFPNVLLRMTSIESLNLEDNVNITSIPADIGRMVGLKTLNLSNTGITKLPFSITTLPNIESIILTGVRLENNDPIVNRFLMNLAARAVRARRVNWADDSQNVHDSALQKSAINCIKVLMSDDIRIDGKTIKWDDELRDMLIKNDFITVKARTSIISYCDEDVYDEAHSILGVKYSDIFPKVYTRILASIKECTPEEIKNHDGKYHHLLQRLCQEVNEAECMCYTGRMNRLINCLNGFYDDIKLFFGSNEDLANIFNITKRTALDRNGIYSPFNHSFIYYNEVISRGYSKKDFDLWGSSIINDFVEDKDDVKFLNNFFTSINPLPKSSENEEDKYPILDLKSEEISKYFK